MSRLQSIDPKHYVAVALFLLYSVAVGVFEFKRQLPLRDDQITTASMVLKDLNPELFPNDPVLGGERYKIYAPPVRALMGIGTRLVGGDVEDGTRLLVPLLLLVFFCSMYLLLNELTGSPLVSFVVAFAAGARRPTLPDTFFGVWGMQSMFARTFFLAFLPLVIWLFWRYRHDRRVLWSFLLLGLISNFHPTGGYAMTPILLLTLLFVRGFNRQTVIDGFLAGVLAVVGISPFILDYLTYPRELLVGNEMFGAVALYPVTADRFDTRGYVLPIPNSILIKALSNGADLLFLSLMAFLIRWKQRDEKDGFILKLMLSVLIVTVGGTGLLQLWGLIRGEPVFYSEIMRGFRFIFIPLFIGAAFFLKGLFRVVSVPWMRWFYFAAFALVILVFPVKNNAAILISYHEEREAAETAEEIDLLDELIVTYFHHLGYNVLPGDMPANVVSMLTGMEAEEAAVLLAEREMIRADYNGVGEWVLANTAVDDRVVIDTPHFKLKGQRELGQQIIPDAIPEAVVVCYVNLDPTCLVLEAVTQEARYIIVEDNFPEISLPVVFENDTYIVYEVLEL